MHSIILLICEDVATLHVVIVEQNHF
jgi:hypothetical protein